VAGVRNHKPGPLPGGLKEVFLSMGSMTATNTVDAAATTVEATTVDTSALPGFDEFAGLIKTTEALQLVTELKGLSETEATKRIDKMSAAEALSLTHLILSADLRKVLKTKLGETTAKHLIHTICTKVQLATYEADDTTRVQSLGAGDEGWGVYAQQAPLGGLGAEIGFVHQEKKDGKFTTQRGAAGFYLRAADETRPEAHTDKCDEASKALAALLG
jgi:hypothetical protein